VNVRFLELPEVLELHEGLIRRFGGASGLRDAGLLESALNQPRATFGGEYLHADPVEMAAAYVFHVVEAHAFVDGNKRIGLQSALVFLVDNGVPVPPSSSPGLYELTMAVARGDMKKAAVASELRRLLLAS